MQVLPIPRKVQPPQVLLNGRWHPATPRVEYAGGSGYATYWWVVGADGQEVGFSDHAFRRMLADGRARVPSEEEHDAWADGATIFHIASGDRLVAERGDESPIFDSPQKAAAKLWHAILPDRTDYLRVARLLTGRADYFESYSRLTDEQARLMIALARSMGTATWQGVFADIAALYGRGSFHEVTDAALGVECRMLVDDLHADRLDELAEEEESEEESEEEATLAERAKAALAEERRRAEAEARFRYAEAKKREAEELKIKARHWLRLDLSDAAFTFVHGSTGQAFDGEIIPYTVDAEATLDGLTFRSGTPGIRVSVPEERNGWPGYRSIDCTCIEDVGRLLEGEGTWYPDVNNADDYYAATMEEDEPQEEGEDARLRALAIQFFAGASLDVAESFVEDCGTLDGAMDRILDAEAGARACMRAEERTLGELQELRIQYGELKAERDALREIARDVADLSAACEAALAELLAVQRHDGHAPSTDRVIGQLKAALTRAEGEAAR